MISRSDKFTICSSFSLSNDDISVLNLLYLPIIKKNALALYMVFYSIIHRCDYGTEEYQHTLLLDLLGVKIDELYQARIVLEGIGLLSTFQKGNEYIYLLRAPLQAGQFLKSNLHSLVLISTIGEDAYENLRQRFKVIQIDKQAFKEVSVSFDDVFKTKTSSKLNLDDSDVLISNDKRKAVTINNYDFDFSLFASQIDPLLIKNGITKEFMQIILTTALNYSFDEADMVSLFRDSLDNTGHFSDKLLKKKAKILYTFKTNEELPKFEIKEHKTKNLDHQEAIQELEALTGEEFLMTLMDEDYNPKYLVNLNELTSELKLNPSVIRVMVMYVLAMIKKRDGHINFPALGYFKKVEDDWIEKGYTDVYKAYNFFLNGDVEPKKTRKMRKTVVKAPTRIEQENKDRDIMEGMDIL